jgi:hypothetical protein
MPSWGSSRTQRTEAGLWDRPEPAQGLGTEWEARPDQLLQGLREDGIEPSGDVTGNQWPSFIPNSASSTMLSLVAEGGPAS